MTRPAFARARLRATLSHLLAVVGWKRIAVAAALSLIVLTFQFGVWVDDSAYRNMANLTEYKIRMEQAK